MSNAVEPPSTSAPPRSAGGGPMILAGVALAAAVIGYLDLRRRLDVLEVRAQVAAGALPGPAAAPAGPAAAPGPAAPAPHVPTGAPGIPGVPASPEAPPAPARPAAPTTVEGPPPDWRCAGSLTMEQVQQGLGRHGRGALACLAAAKDAAPGMLRLRLKVGAAGRVEAVHVAGVTDQALVGCVGKDALTWAFAPPTGGGCAVVEAPFAVGAAK